MDSATTRLDIIALFCILFVAVFFRFEHITQPFIDIFNWREASTAMMAQNFFRGNWNIFYPEVSWTGPGPGYQGREFQLVTYTVALLYKFTGPEDWVGRAIPALAGVWGVVALYALMDITVDRKSALFGAALLAIFPGAVFIDRSFLPDGAMTSLATTSLWMVARFCQSGRRFFLYSAVAVWSLASLVKLQAFTVIGPAIYLFSSKARSSEASKGHASWVAELGTLLCFGGAVVVSYYVWAMHLAAMYPPHHYAGSGKFIFDSSVIDWVDRDYFLAELWYNLNRLLTIPGLTLAIAGLLFFKHKVLVFHWWLLFWLVDFGLEAKHLSIDIFNLSIVHPIAAGLGGMALGRFSDWGQVRFGARGARGTVLISVMLLAPIIYLSRCNINHLMHSETGSELHELGVVLNKAAEPGDLVVSIGLNPLDIFYSGLKGWVFPPADTWSWDSNEYHLVKQDSFRRVEVLEGLERAGATWLVVPSKPALAGVGLSGGTPILANYVFNHYDLVYESSAGRIFRYSRKRR